MQHDLAILITETLLADDFITKYDSQFGDIRGIETLPNAEERSTATADGLILSLELGCRSYRLCNTVFTADQM